MGLSIATRRGPMVPGCLLNGIGGDQWLCGSELCYAEAIAGWRGRELLNILSDDVRAGGLRTTLWRFLRYGIVPLLPSEPSKPCGKAYAKLRRTRPAGKPEWLAGPMRTRFEESSRVRQPLLQRGAACGASASNLLA